jgi:uncharacterized protein (TIGR02186 family)
MMRCARLTLAAIAGVLGGSATPAGAERLVISLSQHRVMVTSSFTGSEVVLFGGIERESGALPLRGSYDIVITVAGPRQDMMVFRKQRFLGIWVNYDSRTFENVPSFFALLSNRKLDAIANADTLRRLELGLDNVVLPLRLDNSEDAASADRYRSALLDLKAERRLYLQESNGVTFLTPALFQAPIPLPAEVPIGTYEVDTKLFADGALVARTPTALEIYKTGFEQFVTSTALNHGLLYGLATALMALLTGWFASVVFRRD